MGLEDKTTLKKIKSPPACDLNEQNLPKHAIKIPKDKEYLADICPYVCCDSRNCFYKKKHVAPNENVTFCCYFECIEKSE